MGKSKKNDTPKGVRISNRKARHDYHISEVVECGLSLKGTEVKSIRAGQAVLSEAYGRVAGGEVVLVGANISTYPQAVPAMQHEPLRDRKLLLHRRQIEQLEAHVRQKGKTLIPLAIYFKNGRAKCELGVAEGKRHYDKRDSLRKRDHQREMAREMRRRR